MVTRGVYTRNLDGNKGESILMGLKGSQQETKERESDKIIEDTMLEFYDSINKEKNEEKHEEQHEEQMEEKLEEKLEEINAHEEKPESILKSDVPVDDISNQADVNEGEVFCDVVEDDISKKEQRKQKKAEKKATKQAAKQEKQQEKQQKKELSQEELLERHKKRKKIAIITISVVLGTVLLVYVGFAFYFSKHILFHTEINGTDFSLKNEQQIESFMSTQVDNYILTLEEIGNHKEYIKGSDIDLTYAKGKQISDIVKKQNQFLWFTSIWKKTSLQAPIGVEYDKTKLKAKIDTLNCMKEENQTPSENAKPEFVNTQFEIKPQVIGTQIDKNVFDKAVTKAIDGFNETVDLEKEGCYTLPQFLSDSKEVAAARDAMNAYLGAKVTYDFNPHTELVDAAVIATWIKVDDMMQVTFDNEAVKGYIASLAEKYDTKGKTIQHIAASGREVEIPPGSFGWSIDQEAEYNALIANIQNAEIVTREPAYSSRGFSHDGAGVGSTYVEVDLSSQVMYFVQNGQLTMQCNIISGNPNKGDATPPGAFYLYNKQRNRTLRGPKKPDGEYEWESPVSYWMPFNGAIGLHDATWQSALGGSLYLSRGSHGCINMYLGEAAQLFEQIEVGTPVLCYY